MPIPKHLFSLVLAATFLVVGFAGCGGSDDPEPAPAPAAITEPEALTRADLIAQGDGLCAEVNAAVGTILNSTTVSDSDKASQVSELYAGLAERLAKLGKPDDGPAPTEVIAAVRQLADPATGDEGASSLSDAAAAYGFTDCGEGPSAPVSTATDAGSSGATSPDAGTTSEAPAPTPAPAPAPAPAPSTGGVTPDAPSTGGAAPPSGGSTGGSSGGSTGGIGPG